jgi:hypothetical protein
MEPSYSVIRPNLEKIPCPSSGLLQINLKDRLRKGRKGRTLYRPAILFTRAALRWQEQGRCQERTENFGN